jgi:hypothetical protein
MATREQLEAMTLPLAELCSQAAQWRRRMRSELK